MESSHLHGAIILESFKESLQKIQPSCFPRYQGSIIFGCGGIHRKRALDGETVQLARVPRFQFSSEKALPEERLHDDSLTERVAMDVGVASTCTSGDLTMEAVIAVVDTKRQALSGHVFLLTQFDFHVPIGPFF